MTSRSIRRIAVCVLALAAGAALVGSTGAIAAKPKAGAWKTVGSLSGIHQVKFKVSKDRKKITGVEGKVREFCGGSAFGSSYTAVFKPKGAWKIKPSGKFGGKKVEKGKTDFGPYEVSYWFQGKFTSAGKAKGKLRMSGIGCDTYFVDFVAKPGR